MIAIKDDVIKVVRSVLHRTRLEAEGYSIYRLYHNRAGKLRHGRLLTVA